MDQGPLLQDPTPLSGALAGVLQSGGGRLMLSGPVVVVVVLPPTLNCPCPTRLRPHSAHNHQQHHHLIVGSPSLQWPSYTTTASTRPYLPVCPSWQCISPCLSIQASPPWLPLCTSSPIKQPRSRLRDRIMIFFPAVAGIYLTWPRLVLPLPVSLSSCPYHSCLPFPPALPTVLLEHLHCCRSLHICTSSHHHNLF